MRVISRSGEQLFARHQFGGVHMHRLEVCALTLTCSKAPYVLHPAPCTLHPTTGLVQADLVFVGDATWRVESGLSPCDDAARARVATLRRIATEEAAALAGLTEAKEEAATLAGLTEDVETNDSSVFAT